MKNDFGAEGDGLAGGSLRFLLGVRRGRHHLIQWQRVSGHAFLVVPALYLIESRLPTGEDLVPVNVLTEYFVSYPEMSEKGRIYIARALGLLFDYAVATAAQYLPRLKLDYADVHRDFTLNFTTHLRYGTIGDGIEGDSTGLCWPPASSRRNTEDLIRALEKFLAYIGKRGLWNSSSIARSLPGYRSLAVGSFFRNLYVAKFKRNVSFWNHLKTATPVTGVPTRHELGKSDRPAGAVPGGTYKFPNEYLAALLVEAYRLERPRPGPVGNVDITGLLHTTLLYGGGLRPLEPLHIWVSDVQVIAGEPVVFLHHPAHAVLQDWQIGAAGSGVARGGALTRERYLGITAIWRLDT